MIFDQKYVHRNTLKLRENVDWYKYQNIEMIRKHEKEIMEQNIKFKKELLDLETTHQEIQLKLATTPFFRTAGTFVSF